MKGSAEKCIIADWLEANMSYRNTNIMVNTHRMDKGLEIIGRSVVMNAAKHIVATYH